MRINENCTHEHKQARGELLQKLNGTPPTRAMKALCSAGTLLKLLGWVNFGVIQRLLMLLGWVMGSVQVLFFFFLLSEI